MGTVNQILTRKGSQVLSISPDASVLDAALLMNEHKIGSLVVLRGDQVVGIFTERDVLTRIVAETRDPATTNVGDVMTAPVACCQPDTQVEETRVFVDGREIDAFEVTPRQGPYHCNMSLDGAIIPSLAVGVHEVELVMDVGLVMRRTNPSRSWEYPPKQVRATFPSESTGSWSTCRTGIHSSW